MEKKKRKIENIAPINSHFLDSGSFTLWTLADEWSKETGNSKWDYYDTEEFWSYMEGYAKFVKKYKLGIDYYANVDVIPNAELSYRNQKWLEEQGLRPVPVVHYGTDLPWIEKYIDEGHDYIGLGGLVGNTGATDKRKWIERVFCLIADSEGLPTVRLHGFGVTSIEYLLLFPWYSVDSTTWKKHGAYGHILVPRRKKGEFIFSPTQLGLEVNSDTVKRVQPWLLTTSDGSGKQTSKGNMHYRTLKPGERAVVHDWLDTIGMSVESIWDDSERYDFESPTFKQRELEREQAGEKREDTMQGVDSSYYNRITANLFFFEELIKHVPEYPWPFKKLTPKGFDLI